MEIIASIVLICVGATVAILMAIARLQGRRRRRAWQAYYDDHRRGDSRSRRRR